jgi:hypothetical protein
MSGYTQVAAGLNVKWGEFRGYPQQQHAKPGVQVPPALATSVELHTYSKCRAEFSQVCKRLVIAEALRKRGLEMF